MRRIEYTRRADRDFERLSLADRQAIKNSLDAWTNGHDVDIQKLTAMQPPRWRIRIGRWRAIVDRPRPDVMRVLRVIDRKDAYR